MLSALFEIIVLLPSLSIALTLPRQVPAHSPCRFSPLYTFDDIAANSTPFINDIFYWEGKFHQNRVGYNTVNGLTYDGCLLNQTTGLANFSGRHDFSAASKEALQIMVYAHAIAGNALAARFVYPSYPGQAQQWAIGMLTAKLKAYTTFNQSFPGYGGFIPWFYANETTMRPTTDWENRVPALDNGELLWAVYAVVHILRQTKAVEYVALADSWERWLDYTKLNAPRIFYNGTGRVCSVVSLNQTVSPTSSSQNYTCEPGTLNDPYEGELFTWWLYFYGNLRQRDREQLWTYKRAQLQAIDYTGSIVNTSASYSLPTNYSGLPVVGRRIGPITVQKGFWFSSHEQWKLLQMPYLDVPIVKRVFHNAERVRTCNSVLMTRNPGMFASVNNITDPATGEILGYISNAGVPSVSSQQEQELDVITPYSVFPTLLFNREIGLLWYKNMLDGQGMQNPYGSTESGRRDGNGVSAFVSWDSKVTTLVALLGGVGDFVREGLVKEGRYGEFKRVLQKEYGRVFGKNLVGEDVALCAPDFQTPMGRARDFDMCAAADTGV